ncbi:MAG TPA: hypothetical protein VFF49_08150 [Thermodesulfobacteriota bacterium]|nr:hypothetical protein [Thermodesulfobacteriota bacterium]
MPKIVTGDVLEVNLTDGYLKIREDSGETHVIKAMISQLIRTAPGMKIEVEVQEGRAVSIKPLVKLANQRH